MTKPMGTVKYNFIDKWEKKEHISILQFNKQSSLFFYGRTTDGSEKKEWIETSPTTSEIEIADAEGWSNYYDFQAQKLISRDLIFSKFGLIEETTPNLNWKMTEFQKKVGSFDCQEAVCTFRGRTFHAWFTMNIPVATGPWKLSGLPGLILEAYDENKEYQFVFVSINLPSNDVTPIIAPILGKKKMTWEEFNIGRKKKLDELKNSIMAEMNSDGNTTIKFEIHNIETF